MERLQELISQLKEQYERQVDPSQMLLTIRLMEAELINRSGQASINRGSAKVAVMMPSSMKMYAGQQAYCEVKAVPELLNKPEASNGAEIKEIPGIRATAEVRTADTRASDNRPADTRPADGRAAEIPVNGTNTMPNGTPDYRTADTSDSRFAGGIPDSRVNGTPDSRAASTPDSRINGVPENKVNGVPDARINGTPENRTNGVPKNGVEQKSPARNYPYDPLTDIPTLAHQQLPRELNDVIGNNGSSLNDKLKGDVIELAASLNEAPVRDLKKAIGVNDRYVFISQLFRGDEVMYERSIKTINGFRILPEAEYWMERELKVKLGWDENRESTRHFYQLVKRRFS